MKFRNLLQKGVTLKRQQAGRVEEGPLGPMFREISAPQVISSESSQPRNLLSPVGYDLARRISNFNLWVLFVNTDGSGVAPWRRFIILDADYLGEGQVESPFRVGMVAHELTHLLQREFKQSHYWPGGGFNPVRGRRWIGDSTNYMEMLAYLVGWTVEYDLTLARQFDQDISAEQRARNKTVLASIRDRLALFTGPESQRASRMISELFPENPIYKQNLKTESRYLDRRTPPGTWHNWLRQMGFSRSAVDHIMVLAARGRISRSDSSG